MTSFKFKSLIQLFMSICSNSNRNDLKSSASLRLTVEQPRILLVSNVFIPLNAVFPPRCPRVFAFH